MDEPHNNQMIGDDVRASEGGGVLHIVYFGGGGNNRSFLSIWGLKLLAGWGSELGIDGREYAQLQTQFRWDTKR